jgi:glycosyltransferase involved in cell wall biosynthesis
MKILIVAAFFPPQNSIASLRPYSWAKYWSRSGHDVTVLTTVKKEKENNFVKDYFNFSIIELPIPLLSTISSWSSKNNLSDPVGKKYFSIWLFLKRIFFSFTSKSGCFYSCRFPDFHDFWAKKAIKRIGYSHFDIVVSTGGPYSVHRVGLALKRKNPNIKWIVDWRDLWTKNHIFSGLKVFHIYEWYLENKFHQNANLIITASEPSSETLRGMTETRVETIYNGFDTEDFQKIKSKPRNNNNAFIVVYTGTIYRGFQDPSSFFKAVSNLKQEKLLNPDILKIKFAGFNSDVSDLADKYNISDFYSYLGFIPREDALQLQYDADAVLFLEYTADVPGILTGKLFEYLYIAKEIISIGKDGETMASKFINDAQAGNSFGNDVGKIEAYLERRILKKDKRYHDKNMELISIYSRNKQAQCLLEYIDKL